MDGSEPISMARSNILKQVTSKEHGTRVPPSKQIAEPFRRQTEEETFSRSLPSKRIISFDGTLSSPLPSLTYLSNLERDLSNTIGRLFDVFIGSGLGGVLACLLACQQSTDRLLKKVKQRPDFVEEVCGPDRQQLLAELLGENASETVGGVKKHLLIVVYNLSSQQLVVISNLNQGPLSKMTLLEALMASTATPPSSIPYQFQGNHLLSGVYGAANPSLDAYLLWSNDRKSAKTYLLSVGLGKEGCDPERLGNDHQAVLSQLANSYTNHRALDQLLRTDGNQYLRVQFKYQRGADLLKLGEDLYQQTQLETKNFLLKMCTEPDC
jgi:hypothetical protein